MTVATSTLIRFIKQTSNENKNGRSGSLRCVNMIMFSFPLLHLFIYSLHLRLNRNCHALVTNSHTVLPKMVYRECLPVPLCVSRLVVSLHDYFPAHTQPQPPPLSKEESRIPTPHHFITATHQSCPISPIKLPISSDCLLSSAYHLRIRLGQRRRAVSAP